jgi:hypothetical protein
MEKDPDEEIRISAKGEQERTSWWTENDGRFTVPDLLYGQWRIEPLKVGFEPRRSATIWVESNKTKRLSPKVMQLAQRTRSRQLGAEDGSVEMKPMITLVLYQKERPYRLLDLASSVQGQTARVSGTVSLAGFKITDQSLENLRRKGVPDDVLERLKPIKDKTFIGPGDFFNILEKNLGLEHAAEFRSLVLEHSLDYKEPLAGVEVSIIDAKNDHPVLNGQTRTDEKGNYNLEVPSLPQTYIFSFEREGYHPYTVMLDQNHIPDEEIYLEPRAEAYEEAIPLIERGEATRRTVFLPRLLQTLPVPGVRTFDAFALLVPGVVPSPEVLNFTAPGLTTGVGTPVRFSVNGLPSRTNNFTIDGSDNNEEDIGVRRQGFVALVPQSVESIGEFQVITALGNARFGRNLGGQLNALSKYGSTALHGQLYGFLTNRHLKAKDFFDLADKRGPATFPVVSLGEVRDPNGTTRRVERPVMLDGKPFALPNPVEGENPFTRSQAGFVFGGPLTRDDTFFFTSFERQDIHASQESHFAVPTVRQRGIFDTGDTGLGRLTSLDPVQVFPLFPASLPGNAIFSLYPFPNNPLGPYGANTYTTVLPADGEGTLFSIKLDHHFTVLGARHTLTGRYNFTDDTSLLPVTGGAIFSSLRPEVRTQNWAFFFNSNISSSTANTVRLSYGRTSSHYRDRFRDPFGDLRHPFLLDSKNFRLSGRERQFLLNAPLLLNVTAPNADGTLNPPTYVSASSQAGRALLNSLGFKPPIIETEQLTGPLGQVKIAGFSPIGVDVFNFPQARANNTFQWADTLTHIRGRHIFTTGFDIRRTQLNSFVDRNFRPLAVFNGLRNRKAGPLTELPIRQPDRPSLRQEVFSGATLAAAGVPTGLFQTLARVPDSTVGLRFTQINFFFQDEIRITPNFRVTTGLRYELNTVPNTVGNRLEGAFDRGIELAKQARSPELCGSRCNDLEKDLQDLTFSVAFGGDRNNIAPRIGFAWDPLGRGRMAVRGGYGVYYDQFLGILINQSRNVFSDFIPLNLANFSVFSGANNTSMTFLFNPANPAVRQVNPNLNVIAGDPLNTLNTLSADLNPISQLVIRLFSLQLPSLFPTFPGLDLVLPARDLRSPYSQQYGITLERELFADYLWAVSYVGTRGVKLLRVATPDLGLNRSIVDFTNVRAFSQSAPFPFFTGAMFSPQDARALASSFTLARTLFESSASSSYNSLQVEVRKRYSHRFQFGAAFTYSHTIDDVSDLLETAGAFALPQNSLNKSERASANFDVRSRLAAHFIWDLPSMKNNWLLRDWQLSGIFTAQSGQPFTVNSSIDVNRDGNLTDRLNSTEGLVVINQGRTRIIRNRGVDSLNLIASDSEDGKIGRNTFRNSGIATLDIALVKRLRVRDRQEFLFRTEVFNLFNRTHFGTPGRILEAPAFGRSVSTTIPARTIQFAVKYSF